MNTSNTPENLNREEYHVMHEGGTEPAFSGKYWDHHETGDYRCKSCGQKLFESGTKLDSSKGPIGLQGWPAFQDALPGALTFKDDDSFGMHRTEVVCSQCSVHLGHLFDDPETETNKHYCINSCSIDFKKK